MEVNRKLLLQGLGFIVVGFALSLGATDQDALITVNKESFEEMMTKRFSHLESKVDSILSVGGSNPSGEATIDIEINHKICSLSSRMIEMENVISALKSTLKTSSFNCPPSTCSDAISKDEFNMRIGRLQGSLEVEKSRITNLEHQLKEISQSAPSFPVSAQGQHICNFTQVGNLSLASHLLRVNTNIFLDKSANASSIYNSNAANRVMNAFDGDYSSQYHSKIGTNPWLFVDLGSTHFIMDVKVSIRESARLNKMKLYAANDATFFRDGNLTTDLAEKFNHSVLTPDLKTVVFRTPNGVCARYVLLLRTIVNEYLIVKEMQGTGYALP